MRLARVKKGHVGRIIDFFEKIAIVVTRDGAVRQLVGLIIRRSSVQIRLPQPKKTLEFESLFCFLKLKTALSLCDTFMVLA
jgi:hypothetical protein